jgi:hypothetical protein
MYYLVFIFLSLFLIIEPKKTSKKERLMFIMLHFSFLLIFIGLRDETGTDWINYSIQFFSEENDHMEFGYLYFSKTLRFLFGNYNVFVFFHAAIYLSIFFLAVHRKYKIGYIVLLLYTGHLLGWMGSNRQILSLMICIFAGEKLYQGKLKTFVSLVIFAALFHYSSIIFILMIVIKKISEKMSLNNYFFTFLFFFAINYILLSSSFVNSISNNLIVLFSEGSKVHGQLIVYASDQFRPDLFISIMMITKRMLTLLAILVMIKLFIRNDLNAGFNSLGKRFKLYFAAYFFSVILLLVFQPIFPLIATRGGEYFYIYEIFLFSIIVSKIKQINYLFFTILFILFCLLRLSLQLSYDKELFIPYKSIWYNTEIERELY